MKEDWTTISLTKGLRKKLKKRCVERDIEYNDLVSELFEIYEDTIPFHLEKEFIEWFEENLEIFGIEKILERRYRSSPDFRVLMEDGAEKEVEAELIARRGKEHIGKDNIDFFVAGYSSIDELGGRPVYAVKRGGVEKVMISVNQETRRRLKKICAKRETHYDELVNSLLDLYERKREKNQGLLDRLLG